MTGKTRVFSSVSEEDTAKILACVTVGPAMTEPFEDRALMPESLFTASDAPAGVIAAVSPRGVAPPATASPTSYLARRFAEQLGAPKLPIVRATQVHGARVVEVHERPADGETIDAGECDALVTRVSGVGLAVQTADCVPVMLASSDAVGAVHAGWRGAAAGVARAAAEAFLALSADGSSVRAWLGPAIGPCCYEVGPEVAGRFDPDLLLPGASGKAYLDLPSEVRRQLEAAGIPADRIMQPNGCTLCGGERYASYRRDGARAGRMIALVARLSPESS
jgi:purine-nucleoside/S-methyl-5'-thioadenosine phosphorylase / adenosine deaminase